MYKCADLICNWYLMVVLTVYTLYLTVYTLYKLLHVKKPINSKYVYIFKFINQKNDQSYNC